jgi:replication factor A1
MPDLLHDRTKMLELIKEKSGKSENEISEMAKKKQEKFAGLLTEEGALFMLAKELGASFDTEKAITEFYPITKLEIGQQGIDVKVLVKTIFPPKSFERNGKKGTRCSLVLTDETGEISLTLWHKDVQKLDELEIEEGTKIALHNCFVTEYNGAKQLNLAYNGAIELLEQSKQLQNKSLKEIVADLQNVNVIARVQQVFEAKKFKKADGEGLLCSLTLNDGTATIRAVAWDELAKQAERLDIGELIKISNAYTKAGLKGIELHLGSRARIIKQKAGLPELTELLKKSALKKSIATLQEGTELQQIDAEILDLNPSLFFSVCPKCGKKPEKIDNKLVCNNCGEIKHTEKKLVLSAMVSDNSGVINAVFYRELAEQLSGLKEIKLDEELENKTREQIIEELKQRLIGRKIVLFANAKHNKISNELELTAKAMEF